MCPPLGAVHSLRAEAGRQAENQQACLGSSAFTRPVWRRRQQAGPRDTPSLRDQPEVRPLLGGGLCHTAPGHRFRLWQEVRPCAKQLLPPLLRAWRDGEGLLQGWSRRQPASLPHPPHHAHTAGHRRAHTRRQTRRVCPRSVLILSCFSDLRVVTALPPAPFLWDTWMWAHTCTHTHTGTPTLPGSNHQPPTHTHRTQHILAFEPPHKCTHVYMELGDCGRAPGTPVRVKRTRTAPQQHSLSGVDPPSRPGARPGPQPGALASSPRKCHFGLGAGQGGGVVCERHADLASVALKPGFLPCRAGLHTVTGRSRRGPGAMRRPGRRMMCVKRPGHRGCSANTGWVDWGQRELPGAWKRTDAIRRVLQTLRSRP